MLTTEKIDGFTKLNFFLSNFYPCRPKDITLKFLYEEDEGSYRTVEHAYQAAKFESREMRLLIQSAKTPSDAKHVGHSCGMRSDWTQIRISVMSKLLKQKFADPMLRTLLLRTGDAELIEGNYWKDTFWGVSLKDGKGRNHLGKLLMRLRFQLRQLELPLE